MNKVSDWQKNSEDDLSRKNSQASFGKGNFKTKPKEKSS
jgi:hypothetical protein